MSQGGGLFSAMGSRADEIEMNAEAKHWLACAGCQDVCCPVHGYLL